MVPFNMLFQSVIVHQSLSWFAVSFFFVHLFAQKQHEDLYKVTEHLQQQKITFGCGALGANELLGMEQLQTDAWGVRLKH